MSTIMTGPAQRSLTEIASSHPEVEFALVLARTIDSVQADPEQLRSAVYELARHKLQQLSEDDPEKARLLHALEIAIAGVEAHTRDNPPDRRALPPPQVLALPGTGGHSPSATATADIGSDPGAAAFSYAESKPRKSKWSSSAPLRYLVMLLCVAGIFGLIELQRSGMDLSRFRSGVAQPWRAPKVAPPAQSDATLAAVPVVAEPTPKPLLPTAYGVYAASAGKLYDLQTLQGRVPDPRVAISAAITKPSETVLPDGHPKFIVFRREANNGASDAIEVRIIARVKQATSYDATGKPVVTASDDSWVIRNIGIPYRAAPLKDDPQMYEIQPRDPDATLSPGRYALVIKGIGFDFVVDGAITDKRHCLERLAAANGVFYSECEKP